MSLSEIRALGQGASTGNIARAVIGEALRQLHDRGYGRLDDITDAADASAAAARLLDQARSYAEGVYNGLPATDLSLPSNERDRVGAALYSCADSIKAIEDATKSPGLVDGFRDALITVLRATGGAVSTVTTSVLGATWPLLTVLAVVALVVVYAKGKLP